MTTKTENHEELKPMFEDMGGERNSTDIQDKSLETQLRKTEEARKQNNQ